MIDINIIADGSGSINEWGKKDLMEYLLRSVYSYVQDDRFNKFNFIYFVWNENIRTIGTDYDFTIGGKSNVKCLLEFISKNRNKTLLLSDGNFTISKKEKFCIESLLPVAVGCECNKSSLRKLSSKDNVYNTDNILTAINDLCFGGV